ncbi:serine acetyltransferase [Pontibacter brevis]
MSHIFQDWSTNQQNIKGRIVLVLFRLAQLASRNKLTLLLLSPYLVFYKVVVEWFLGIELPYSARVGKNLFLAHGQALVVIHGAVIGDNCVLRQSTTIGIKRYDDGTFSGCPVIGNNVDIGSNVCIIGEVRIGNNVKIGAGSVVVKDVPDNAIVVGNPARIIKQAEPVRQAEPV